MGDAFLDRLIGEWTYEGHSIPPEGAPRTGVETVSRRGVWLVIAGDQDHRFHLAFDQETDRIVGDFISWDYPTLWTYVGVAEADRMALNSRGPRMDGSGGEADYQDVWEILSPDTRRMIGRVRGDDGEWRDFSTTDYRRKAAP